MSYVTDLLLFIWVFAIAIFIYRVLLNESKRKKFAFHEIIIYLVIILILSAFLCI